MKFNQRARTKFERWVLGDGGGTRKLSVKLNISQTAVQHWCAKRASPNLHFTEKLLKLANGKLSIADIVEGTKKA